MPRTIDEGFRDFLTKLTPSSTETGAAKSHRSSIEARLKSEFGLRRFFRIGSFGNGTSISGYSDVDYLASLSNDTLTSDSGYSLRKIRDALDESFPATGVRVSCPAVVVPFGSEKWETTEIVPGDFVKESPSGHYVYDIPDCSGGWMRASPEAHIAYVARVNSALGGKVKPLVRFVKAWKFYRSVPISSFYLELRVAKYCEGETSIVYPLDLKRVLCDLRDSGLAGMHDPMGFSGLISPCKTDGLYDDAMGKLETAAQRAENAVSCTAKGKIQEAFEWWDKLYYNEFPAYYR